MRVYVILCIILACVMQHIIHELSHVLAAKAYGIKVIRIQWLTYHGGTKVFMEGEPDYNGAEAIDRKWAVIGAAGFIVTNLMAYSMIALYCLLTVTDLIYLRIFLYLVGILFLIVDSAYFLLGSLGDFGDISGIRMVMKMKKSVSIILSLTIFLINIFICMLIW